MFKYVWIYIIYISIVVSKILSCFIEFDDNSIGGISYTVFIMVVNILAIFIIILGFCKLLVTCDQDSCINEYLNNANIKSCIQNQNEKILIIDNVQDDLFRISISDCKELK
ncbi:hypothetical protein P4P91_001454 [Campylobacter jejuni]|nr:hypothetical protein [Campylobacter jejuni]